MLTMAATQLADQLRTSETPSTLMPSPSVLASLLHHGQLITKDYRSQLREAYHLPQFQSYTMDKFGWTASVYSSVDWSAIAAAHKRRPVHQQIRLSKFMYGWLPIGRTRTRIDPTCSDKCPSCHGRFESSVHLLRCRAQSRRILRVCQLDTLRHFLQEWHTPPAVSRILLAGLHRLRDDPSPTLALAMADGNATLRNAIQTQNLIGWNRLPLGFIAADFLSAAMTIPHEPAATTRHSHRHTRSRRSYIQRQQLHHDANARLHDPDDPQSQPKKRRERRPLSWSAKFVTAMWNFFEEQWQVRNKDLHGHDDAETASLQLTRLHSEVDRLYALQDSLLFADRIIFSKSIDEIKQLSLPSLEIWLQHVNNSMNRCFLDAADHPPAQRLLTDYFSSDTGIT